MKQKPSKTIFVCQNCGYKYPKWLGKCPQCNEFYTMVEEVVKTKKGLKNVITAEEPVPITQIKQVVQDRIPVGVSEIDRVFGGGIVPGSVNLIGGDPGIGKSTLTLQMLEKIATPQRKALYVTSEESSMQLKIRADRLGIKNENIFVLAETNFENIKAHVEKLSPSYVVIDSIQMVYDPSIDSAPGMIGQVRWCATDLVFAAKQRQITTFIIGHVTKEGFIAGPKSLEHIVDGVFYFEGERYQSFRLLRAVKNRYGSTNEVGIFEMLSQGLAEVPNPSELFMSLERANRSGSVIVPSLIGTRTLLVEIQALTSKVASGYPARRVSGVDFNRVNMLIAVLNRRIGMPLHEQDIYVNAVGGVKIDEPCADLGIALAIASSFCNKPIYADAIAIGEVGLAGEVRGVSHINLRIAEAKRLGFKLAVIPKHNLKSVGKIEGLEIKAVSTLYEPLTLLNIL